MHAGPSLSATRTAGNQPGEGSRSRDGWDEPPDACRGAGVESPPMVLLRLALVVLVAMVCAAARRLVGRRLHPCWSWRTEVVAVVARWAASKILLVPSQVARAAFPGAPLRWALRRQLRWHRTELGGVPAELTVPLGWSEPGPTLLYVHGGGYVLCSPATHRELVARLALALGARCYSIDYRLAPEHPFPTALDDVMAAYRALLEQGQAVAQLVVAGDSAGGGLCLAAMVKMRASGLALPRAAALLSPWVDLAVQGDSVETNARYDYLRRELLERCALEYLQGASASEPLASPLYADLGGLPPLLVHSGSAEGLLTENRLLVERARAVGVSVVHTVFDGMFHAFHGFSAFVPEARAAICAVADFLRAELSSPARREPKRAAPPALGPNLSAARGRSAPS